MKKALVLLNMGAARNKEELEVFLTNMLNDENIVTIHNTTIRSMLASFIVTFRLNNIWKNYEKIGGSSPLHQLTKKLIEKLEKKLPEYFITDAMRYTLPFAQTAIARIEERNIQDIVILPLYPHYATTTVKSSVDDFMEKIKDENLNIKLIEPFYQNEIYNKAICDEIIRVQSKYNDFHLIFSARGLPQKIANQGDPYQKQVEEHVELLKEKLTHYATNIKSINLAYQSKIGPLRWLSPSLEDMLQYFKDEKVIICPISFAIDNSETVFDLEIKYRKIAKKLGIKEYRVCQCPNDSDIFVDVIKEIISL